jgi:bifunctional UDP-N-acetylglucosamine pyrophosphorylase/glucosamine-1-phosphate N-acetyltransferase
MTSGVMLYDPARLDIRGELICGKDVQIDINCLVEGKVELQDGVTVGPNVCLKDSVIGAGTTIRANCIIEESKVGENVIIGPFARLRPGAQLQNAVHVGNFVEIKNSFIDDGSKVNHLSYIGDSRLGKGVNVGAGTITCNYDGAAKHQTIIDDEAFIGSGTELVAPIRIGKGVTVGAGSTLSKDVPDNNLIVERAKPRVIKDWQRPKKK